MSRQLFNEHFAMLGYHWSESNQDKAYLGWQLHEDMMKNGNQWEESLWHLGRTQHPLEYLINVTPTGPCREALTEANIHLMVAIKALERAKALTED